MFKCSLLFRPHVNIVESHKYIIEYWSIHDLSKRDVSMCFPAQHPTTIFFLNVIMGSLKRGCEYTGIACLWQVNDCIPFKLSFSQFQGLLVVVFNVLDNMSVFYFVYLYKF